MSEMRNNLMARRGLMPVADAARATGYDQTHMRRLVDEGKVQGEQVAGRWWYVSRKSLAEYVGKELAKAAGIHKRLEGEAA